MYARVAAPARDLAGPTTLETRQDETIDEDRLGTLLLDLH